MAKHSEIGVNGEQLACDFLLNKGYIVLERNWRYGKKEIDIIARNAGTIAIVEVKTRSSTSIQYPEEAVTRRKKDLLKAAAMAYSESCDYRHDIRYDIISVWVKKDGSHEIVHFEEAFH